MKPVLCRSGRINPTRGKSRGRKCPQGNVCFVGTPTRAHRLPSGHLDTQRSHLGRQTQAALGGFDLVCPNARKVVLLPADSDTLPSTVCPQSIAGMLRVPPRPMGPVSLAWRTREIQNSMTQRDPKKCGEVIIRPQQLIHSCRHRNIVRLQLFTRNDTRAALLA